MEWNMRTLEQGYEAFSIHLSPSSVVIEIYYFHLVSDLLKVLYLNVSVERPQKTVLVCF